MSSDNPSQIAPHVYEKPRHGINLAVIGVVVVFVVYLLWVVMTLRDCRYATTPTMLPVRSSRRRSTSRRHRFHFTGEEPARLRNVGLDSAVIATLPVFVYKPRNFRDRPECAVCLSELEEDEKCRLLPNCRHIFHVECIDMWLFSHSTCPICRIQAQPEQPVLESARLPHVSVTIPRPIASGIHDNLTSEHRHSTANPRDFPAIGRSR